jgi:hypothetical protein
MTSRNGLKRNEPDQAAFVQGWDPQKDDLYIAGSGSKRIPDALYSRGEMFSMRKNLFSMDDSPRASELFMPGFPGRDG